MAAPNIEIIEIKVAATPGANIGVCIQDALKLATNEWRNVRLRHMDQDYLIKVNDLVAAVTKDEGPVHCKP